MKKSLIHNSAMELRNRNSIAELWLNVSEVAYAVGFSSSAYFAKCFKSVYGMTPTEYIGRTNVADET